jgi:hypothetical protein
MSQASTNSLPMPRVRPRILAMLTTGADERRSTESRQRPNTSGCSAAFATSRWAMKKSVFADSNTTTLTDGSASRSVMRAPNSTIVVGTNMLIGGLPFRGVTSVDELYLSVNLRADDRRYQLINYRRYVSSRQGFAFCDLLKYPFSIGGYIRTPIMHSFSNYTHCLSIRDASKSR